MSQYGTVTETITFTDQFGNVPFQYEVQLSQFPRSLAVTGLYQFYRLKYIKYQYIPKLALGTQVAPGDTTSLFYGRPMRLYYMMNRQSTDPAGLSLQNFLEKGCKPIPFGDSRSRAVVVSYKPNLTGAINPVGPRNSGTMDVGSIEPLYNKWINRWTTDTMSGNVDIANDDTDWQGYFCYIEDYNQSTIENVNVAEVRVTAVWEYKNPYMPITATDLQNPDVKTVIKAT